MTNWRQLALVALVGLAGCGELETPDFAHGSIAGRVVGATLDGFAYPLGHPELAKRVESDGSFRFDGQAVGPVQLVVYDDSLPGGTRRAELVQVVVPGAGVARFERNGEAAPVLEAAKMAWAGAIVATVSPDGGGIAAAPRFAVEGTTLAATRIPGTLVTELGLLPPASGVYRLTASADGYRPATRPIDVASATNGFDVALEIDTSGAGPRGCDAPGGGCVNGLKCDASSGGCVQCLVDADCASGSCDSTEHFCNAPPPGDPVQGAVCASCTDDTQCEGGAENPGRCEKEPGATSGSCTWAPTLVGYCPAGFQYAADAIGTMRCVPPISCESYFAEFGESCFSADDCLSGGEVAGAICYGADPVGGLPGYCTAACRLLATPADSCVVPGFHCDTGLLNCIRN